MYAELCRLAAVKIGDEPYGHTLDATALVHAAFLKLGEESFPSRGGFVRTAAGPCGGSSSTTPAQGGPMTA